MNRELKWQCVLCGYLCPENLEEPPKNCPDCNCPKFREVTNLQPQDAVNPDTTAHLKKKMENCMNYDVDPKAGKKYHKLVLERRIDYSKAARNMDPKMAQITIQERCRECRELYGQRVVPLSRPDVLERLGVLEEVEQRIGKLETPTH